MLKKNQVFRVPILDLNNLGFGVAKIDGISVFVADTVTGDTAEIQIIKTAKTYAVGKLLQLISPSSLRTDDESKCAVSHRCGGCVYQSITYAHELALKKNYIAYAMKKAGVLDIEVLDVLTTNKISGYRNKAQYPVGKELIDGKERTVIGFYAPKTHKIIPADHCDLQPTVFSSIVSAVAAFCDRYQVSAYSETDRSGVFRHLYLRSSADGSVLLCLVINADKFPHEEEFCREMTARFPQIVSIQINENTADTNVILGEKCRVIYGADALEDVLCNKRFRISPLSFYQVNHDGAELLYQQAKEMLNLRTGEVLLDLYCGIGTIGLSIAEADTPLIGIEIVPQAVENAKENAARNQMKNAQFFCGDASDAADILSKCSMTADAVIVDPPRKGLTTQVIDYLDALSPSRIVYISCDADTLARDIVRFSKVGYRASMVQPVDMFSRTGHVECVVCLSREKD